MEFGDMGRFSGKITRTWLLIQQKHGHIKGWGSGTYPLEKFKLHIGFCLFIRSGNLKLRSFSSI